MTFQCGIAQGSKLGRMQLLLYVIDIVILSSVMFPILFADDTNVIVNDNKYLPLITLLT